MKKALLFLLMAVSIAAYSTSVTFKVDMKGSGMDYDTLYIVGTLSDWQFIAMADEGDSIHSVTLDLTDGDSAVYYFITQNTWDGYMAAREPVIPNECGDSTIATWAGDRAFIVPLDPITYAWVWGTCEVIGGGVGITNLSKEGIKVYPNPTSGLLYIDLSEFNNNTIIEVLDLTGKVNLRQNVTDRKTLLDLSGLPSSLYFIKVSDGQGTVYHKVMIK